MIYQSILTIDSAVYGKIHNDILENLITSDFEFSLIDITEEITLFRWLINQLYTIY